MKRWRRGLSKETNDLLPTLDDTQLLDTQEQEKIVQSFEVSHSWQSFIWRGVFALFAGAFSIFFIVSAYQQATSPWATKHHSYFMEDLNAITIVTADVIEATVFAVTAWGLLSQRATSYHLLWLSLAAGLGLTIFWLYHMLRLSRMHWNLLWLPLGPSGCAALCIYVDHLLLETEKEVNALRLSMYHFKKT